MLNSAVELSLNLKSLAITGGSCLPEVFLSLCVFAIRIHSIPWISALPTLLNSATWILAGQYCSLRSYSNENGCATICEQHWDRAEQGSGAKTRSRWEHSKWSPGQRSSKLDKESIWEPEYRRWNSSKTAQTPFLLGSENSKAWWINLLGMPYQITPDWVA